MKPVVLFQIVLAAHSIVSIFGVREPKCGQFDYDERLLEKLIRLEVKFEAMLQEMKHTEKIVKEDLEALSRDRRDLHKRSEEMKSTLTEAFTRKIDDLDAFKERFKLETDERVRSLEDRITRNIAGLGAVYTRWGRTVCPNDTTTIYRGYAAGSHNTHKGGPVKTLCLPHDPQYSNHYSGQQSTYVYGAEYQAENAQFQAIFGNALQDQDVPCAVCKTVGRATVLTVPARTECYSGWHLEYSGYLMASHHTEPRTSTKCVDGAAETIPGQSGNNNGDLFYFVEAAGQIPDPPYTRGKELTCAVCSQ